MTPFDAPHGPSSDVSRADAIACLELIHRSLDCEDSGVFTALMLETGILIEADYCACILARESSQPHESFDERAVPMPQRSPLVEKIIAVNGSFPESWIELYEKKNYYRVDPIVIDNYRRYSFQFWADTYLKIPPPRDFRREAEEHGLSVGCSQGLRNGSDNTGSLFSFSGPQMTVRPRTIAILGWVLPHLHRTLCRFGCREAQRTPLTPRELEVLRWIGAGKSSWEIALILGISERTVNFHSNNILRKLDTVNRSQAVVAASKLGLI